MNFISVVLIAFKRLWNNKGLTLCLIIGLVTAVALMSSIPLYTDAANFRVLKEQLSGAEEGRWRPPFAFMYRYIGAWHGAIEIEDFDPVNEYIRNSVPDAIGLPALSTARYVKSDNFSLFPVSEAAYIGIRQPLGWVSLGFVDGFREHVTIIEGDFPQVATGDTEVIEVLISQEFAEQTGLQPGEEYIAFRKPDAAPSTAGTTSGSVTESRPVQFRVRVSGIWLPIDDTDPYWFYSPKSLATNLAVPEETFRTRIAPSMEKEIYAAVWYVVFDGEDIRTDDVPELTGRINYTNSRVGTLLPNTVLDISPLDELEEYRFKTFVMTIVLYVFSVPILGLVLYFIGLISGLVVERQRGEIAILKSRGTGDFQVVGIYALQSLVVGVIGLVGGMLVGRWLAVVMGNTVSFLTFGDRQPLPVVITPRSLRLALLGVAIAFVASLSPAMRAARLTIVTYKRDRARAMEKPFWQRYLIDFLLLIPAGYGYYTLSNRGTINFLGSQAGGNPFQDPLLFLVPSIAILACSLLLVRLFPLLMEALAWLTGQVVRAVSVVLAFRQLARVSKQYVGSLLLLILTLSLATFTASMARTLDQSMLDSWHYRYGADYALIETGENTESVTTAGEGSTPAVTVPGAFQGWIFVPVGEHLKVDGITAATRVGSYPAEVRMARASARGRFFGIDRLDFPKVGFFRNDFAWSSFGTLMNRLALDNSAILVTPQFLRDLTLGVGDRVPLTISVYGERREVQFVIADVINYFPTFYPDEQNNIDYFFVGNLEYIFEQMGGEYPYDVWIRTEPNVDITQVINDLKEHQINVVSAYSSATAIEKEQAKPERTGVFGILSVGFVAAALLTVLGFLLHTYISFRQRYIEFGVMRAIGLSVGQMISFLGTEQLMLIVTGITSGTLLGVMVSRVFIPFLQVGTGANANIPPFVVLIAWGDILRIYAVFGVMLMAAVGSMIYFLLHLRIFEAVKLGEAV
jgi:putative ABC transport system permease protein